MSFDDSIISDTAAEKAQDLAELGLTLAPWEYRAKWYGEGEATARRRPQRGTSRRFRRPWHDDLARDGARGVGGRPGPR